MRPRLAPLSQPAAFESLPKTEECRWRMPMSAVPPQGNPAPHHLRMVYGQAIAIGSPEICKQMPTSHAPSNPAEVVKVLLISSQSEDKISLQHIFNHSNWFLYTASTCREALAYLSHNDTAVVICEQDLPDGDWKLVLNRLDSLPMPPNLIVTSRLADNELWAEVLNLGGYDVLAQPFDAQEVYRVVFLAWHAHKRRIHGSAERNPGPETAQAKSCATA
jgi:hypothetical protein